MQDQVLSKFVKSLSWFYKRAIKITREILLITYNGLVSSPDKTKHMYNTPLTLPPPPACERPGKIQKIIPMMIGKFYGRDTFLQSSIFTNVPP